MPRRSAYQLWLAFFALVIAIGVLAAQGLVIAFGSMGLLAGGISWIWNRFSLQELSYERTLDQSRVFLGEEVRLTLSVTNKKPIPLPWLKIEEELMEDLQVVDADVSLNAPPGSTTLRHSTSMGWYERIRWDYRIKCTRRGLFPLGPAYLESGDPFGFFRSRRRKRGIDYLTVYPTVIPLDDLGIPAFRPLGEVRGGIKLFVDTSRPSGMRDYQVGDPLKTVDWKATARHETLQVRTYDPSSSTTVILVVAIDSTTPYWARYSPEVLERVVTVAASVAVNAVDNEYTVGMFANDMRVLPNQPLIVPPARGPDQLAVLLEAIATIRPYPPAPMWSQLAQHAWRFPTGSTLVVCTGHMPQELEDTLNEIRRRGSKIVIVNVGEEPCVEFPPEVVVHETYDRLIGLEEAGELVTG